MTKGKIIGFWAAISLLSFIVLNCTPERDNPYDPKSPYLNFSHITGRVITKVGNPINNAEIALVFQNINKTISTVSDSNGNYGLQYLYTIGMDDTAYLFIRKSNYAIGEKPINPRTNSSDTINYILDALPQVSNESLTSYHERFLFPAGDNYAVNIRAKVTDQDGQGDIDQVYLLMPAIADTFILDYYPTYNIYRKTIPVESISGNSLENLIGTDCYIEVVSVTGIRTKSSPIRLNRIIYEVPEPIAPSGDTVGQNFQCVWNNLPLSYPYTYGVEIYYLRGLIPELTYQATSISSNDTTFIIPVSFSIGTYYWQVSVKDGFGNIAKSIQLLFYLQ